MQRGTKHKAESVESIKTKTKQRWDKIPAEERSKIMKDRALIRIKNKQNVV